MLHHFITQYLKNMLLYSIETGINQYLQLILHCYFTGHAVEPLVVVDAFLISFLASCHILGTSPLNYVSSDYSQQCLK